MKKESSRTSDACFKLEGPGIDRVLQEAFSLGRTLGILYYLDTESFPLKIGYIFADKKTKYKISDLKWFTEEDDVWIIRTLDTNPKLSQADLKATNRISHMKYDIDGPGMDRIIREASSLGKTFGILCYLDAKGFPLKYGYCFSDKTLKYRISDVRSFTEEDDIRVICEYSVSKLSQVSFNEPPNRNLLMKIESSIIINVRYDIEGPGKDRVIQEAVSLNKNCGFVSYQDFQGRPVKIGYFFADRGRNCSYEDADVRWFTKDDNIRVIPTTDDVPPISQSSLRLTYSTKNKSERNFLLMIPLDGTTDLLFRNVFRIKRGHVTDFAIQVETMRAIGREKKQHDIIVRYDCAHGFLHRDLYVSNGRKIKNELPTQEAKKAITYALEEIKTHLNVWLPQLECPSLPMGILESTRVAIEFDLVKLKLLELYEYPGRINSTLSQFVQYVNTLN